MKRNLKALGLAALTTLAIAAVAAPAVQAKQAEFTAAKYPAVFTMYTHEEVAWDDYFEFTPGYKMECTTEKYESTVTAATTKITVTPHYTGCTAKGLNVTVDLNGCHYVFEAGTAGEDGDAHCSVQIVCPAGKQIEITQGGVCTVDIPSQTLAGTLTITNINAHGNTSATYSTIHVDVTNKLHYIDTDPSFFCAFTGTQTFADGDWVTTIVVKGYEDIEPLGNVNTPGTNLYSHKPAEINIDVKPKA